MNVIFHRSINWNKNALTLSVFRYLQDFEVVEALEHGARDVSQVVAREPPVEGQKKCFGSFAVQHIDDFNREMRIWWIHKGECVRSGAHGENKSERSPWTQEPQQLGFRSLWPLVFTAHVQKSLFCMVSKHVNTFWKEPRYECALSSFCLLWQQTRHSTAEFIYNGRR